MTTLGEVIEDKYGSQMQLLLYFDFGYIEAATWYMKNHQRTYSKSDIKKILDQVINKHAKNQNDTHNDPIGWAVDYCFEAWWKDLPSPRSLEEQESENKEHPGNIGSYEEVVGRVQAKQAQVLMDEQMHAAYEDEGPRMGQAENEALAQRLLSSPEKVRLAWHNFKGITEGQLFDKLGELGILDKSIRNRVMKYLLALCNRPSDVMTLLDNELPLSARTVAKWVMDHLDHEAVYVQDSDTWYYRHNNKYMSTPDCDEGNPISNLLEDYYDLCSDYQHDYPLFSKTISTFTDKLQDHTKNLYYLIGNVETHTESEFNNNVLKEGRFCTPNGLYDYTRKISDSNGLTKVATKANILNLTDQEIDASEGVRLFADFMTQIQPDIETRDYLIGVIANAITGHRENEYTYIFHGSTGANGKSVLTEFLQDMLGDYYESYHTDSLVRGSKDNPEQAAKALENRRLVSGSEIGDGSTINGGAFKRYFSNDSYRINEKFKAPYTVKPTHTMFLPVNQMPNFGSDPAVRRRLVVIPFTEHFVMNPDPKNPHEHKLDPDTKKKLIAHEDEIFTYLVRYAEQLRERNITLTVPATVQHYGDDMVDENNIIADYIEYEASVLTEEQINNKDIPTPITTGTELYERFLIYIAASGAYNPYKTYTAFISALLLKYPQLNKKNARTTDNKVVKSICGIWLDPTTTAAKQLEAKRWNKELDAPSPFPTFKASIEYQDWINKEEDSPEATNQAEQYATTEQENPERATTDYKVDSLMSTPAPQYEYWKTPQSINPIGQQFAQDNIADIVKNMSDPAGLF